MLTKHKCLDSYKLGIWCCVAMNVIPLLQLLINHELNRSVGNAKETWNKALKI